MPSEGRSKNFGDGTFVSGSDKYVKEQYNTNKALLDAVSSMVVGMNVQDFLKVAVQKIPAAQKEFSELYGEEVLAVKIGRGMMAMYKAAPRKVKATIIEGLVMQHGLTWKDLQEGLGVTKWQWNKAQLALQECASGKKQKASRGVAMKVDEATVEKFVDFCLRPDNIQDVAFGLKQHRNDQGFRSGATAVRFAARLLVQTLGARTSRLCLATIPELHYIHTLTI